MRPSRDTLYRVSLFLIDKVKSQLEYNREEIRSLTDIIFYINISCITKS